FFQAEDGIRGKLVTGVQTCALPISRAARSRPAAVLPWIILGAGLLLAALAGALGVVAGRRAKAKSEVDRFFTLSTDLITVAGLEDRKSVGEGKSRGWGGARAGGVEM